MVFGFANALSETMPLDSPAVHNRPIGARVGLAAKAKGLTNRLLGAFGYEIRGFG
jgi:hypothetical protein